MSASAVTVAGVAAVSLALLLIKVMKRKKWLDLHGKVVVITGASSGLGEACALAFYQAGAKVILCSRRMDQLERVKECITKTKSSHERFAPVCVVLDLADIKSLAGTAQDIIGIHGHVDILVNNAGISYRGDIASTDIMVHQQLMNVNYFGQVELTKAFLPHMTSRRSGHIVAISSVQGRISIPFRSAYSASKHALQAYFDCLRAEVSDQGVRVSVVSPGYIQSNLSLNALTSQGNKYGVMDKTTAGGMLACEVAGHVLQCVKSGQNEVILAPTLHKLVVCLRSVWPSMYFYIMQRRARKQWKERVKQE